MTQEVTDSKTLNQIIEQYNPFTFKVTTQSSVWNQEYSGVSEINQNAFDSIIKLIDDVDTGKSQSEGAAIVGERGLGKTQIFARLHHHLNSTDKAFFVYMGEYDNLEAIKSEFLQALVYSLKREFCPNVTQWQALAAEMYFDARGDRPCPIENLVRQFPNILGKNPNLVNIWTNGIAKKCPDVKNVFLIRAILWTLLPETAPFAAMWLAGKTLSDESAKTLGLPNDRETDSLACAFDLLNLIIRYKTVVICFDELDAPAVCPRTGNTLAQVIASLAKDIRNNVNRLVILLSIFSETLRDQFRTDAQGGAIDRFERQIKPEGLNQQASFALIEHRLLHFYKQHNVVPPHSLYPFDKDKLIDAFSKERATARQVLRWCEANFTPPEPIERIDPPKPPSGLPPVILIPRNSTVEQYYQQHLQNVQSDFDRLEANLLDDAEKITKALRFAFDHLIGQVVDEMQIFAVIDEQDRAYKDIVPFKVKVRKAENKNGHYAFIGIAVVQKKLNSLTKALEKLVKFNELNQTRACLIRSEDIGGKMAREYALEIIQKGGEWVQFHTDHIIPILALQSFLDKLSQDDQKTLTENQIWEYVSQERILIDNPLIKEILSKPETKVSKDFKLSDLADLASKLERIPKTTPTSASFVADPNSVTTEDLKDDFS
jgi:hypothetical protein